MATIAATTTPPLKFSELRTRPTMNPSLSLLSKLRPSPSRLLHLRPFSAVDSSPTSNGVRAVAKASSEAQVLKDNWLASLSGALPPARFAGLAGDGEGLSEGSSGSDWVIGVDPDTCGAVAVLRGPGSDCSAQVFDSPHVPVLVGGRVRKRLDAKSITELLRSFDVPVGTTAYIEQSMPFPKDGKQGWWSGGFGYGLWIGILVALGFSVVPVSSVSWKRKFEIFGSSFTKDDSRNVASTLFPSLSLQLKRKKDHGRADALLIAAYGRGLKMDSDSSLALEEVTS